MTSFQIFTIIGIAFTAAISIFNLFLSIRSQRKVHRELIFNKQFDFFVKLFELIAFLDDAINDCNQSYPQAQTAKDRINQYTDKLDLLITKNELIIPDNLYKSINDFERHCWSTVGLINNNVANIDEKYNTEFTGIVVDLQEDIRDFLGVEKLSEENKKLVYSKF